VSREDYMYAWILVNTRTFYYTTPKTEKLPRDDRMALQPVADLFNHADEGCNVAFDAESFTFTSQRAYSSGEEIHICYGRHSNDFLLVEYGFLLGRNRWDEVCLDEVILPELTDRQRRHLEDASFLGKYVLDYDTVCYRTQMALRILCMPLREWQNIADGFGDGDAHQGEVDQRLLALLRKFEGSAKSRIDEINRSDAGKAWQREILITRWRQIGTMIASTIKRIEP
jgi:hypothetical protein